MPNLFSNEWAPGRNVKIVLVKKVFKMKNPAELNKATCYLKIWGYLKY